LLWNGSVDHPFQTALKIYETAAMLSIAAVFLCDAPMIVVFTFFVMPYQYKADGVVLATDRETLISFKRTMLRHSHVFLLSRMPTIRIVATMTNQLTRSCKKV